MDSKPEAMNCGQQKGELREHLIYVGYLISKLTHWWPTHIVTSILKIHMATICIVWLFNIYLCKTMISVVWQDGTIVKFFYPLRNPELQLEWTDWAYSVWIFLHDLQEHDFDLAACILRWETLGLLMHNSPRCVGPATAQLRSPWNRDHQ
jgi:hypothetical protein